MNQPNPPTLYPGQIVRLRDREWIMLPSDDVALLKLRPIVGNEDETLTIYQPALLETPRQGVFPPPDINRIGDLQSARLLLDATRLSLRDGAGPFRSFGRISVRPRPYQLVPLLMALRLDVIRLLIADDVGIGKTIEAATIAREMIDRREIRRMAVLCPPNLCDQWQQELQEKFHLPAVVVRSGTLSQLEKQLPSQDTSIFAHFSCMVISIDFAKSERRRDNFLLHAPELIIVDEAHTAARPAGRSANQQQRHELLRALSQNPDQHLILLTATPHSGIEESFRSLLGLLNPTFEDFDLGKLSEAQRIELAKQFIQRRRADVRSWLGADTPFPERITSEISYTLDPGYRQLFNDVYAFASAIVKTGETLTGFKRRVRYWTALALLRCVMSSPAAAEAALEGRAGRLENDDHEADDVVFSPYVYDIPDAEEASQDMAPAYVTGEENALDGSERRKLKHFAAQVRALRGSKDAKLQAVYDQVAAFLPNTRGIIVYCRYIATADYLAIELQKRLSKPFPNARVLSVTGTLADDERRARIIELSLYPQHVLVATDCLSEGINLQDGFDVVIHYDLPWNPNRLEQREGRIDRYGQRSPTVQTTLLYGADNPIDGAVLDVLIRKAVEIRRTLGITVPVPIESESVVEAVVKSLFLHGDVNPQQLSLFEDGASSLDNIFADWNRSAEREKESRSRFAQHAIKPAEVAAELEETDQVLGDEGAVERFILTALQRLEVPTRQLRNGWKPDMNLLPETIKARFDSKKSLLLTFSTPIPDGTEFVGRNHVLTASIADYLLTNAILNRSDPSIAARLGMIQTTSATKRTTILLLRCRYLIQEAKSDIQSLAEECLVLAFRGRPGNIEWLPSADAIALLDSAQPMNAVIPQESKRQTLTDIISWLQNELHDDLITQVSKHTDNLAEAHRRIRKTVKLGRVEVKPSLPVDVLGVYVLMPAPTF